MLTKFFSLIGAVAAAASAPTTSHMKQALDDMADHYHKGAKYDPEYFANNITSCMAKFDDDLTARSQDTAWLQFTNYWLSNGTDSDYMNQTDHWGQCQQGSPYDSRCVVPPYMRRTPSNFGPQNIAI